MSRRAIGWILALLALSGSLVAGMLLSRLSILSTPLLPLEVEGTLQGEPMEVRAAIAGRLRLLAVGKGDRVKAGQLIAWLEAPDLRDDVRAAEDAVKIAQEELDSLRGRRPGRAQEAYARAQSEHTAAQRALEDAQERAGSLETLTRRLEEARTAREEAGARVAEMESRLAQARATATRPDAPASGGALESGTDAHGVGDTPAYADSPAVSQAQADLDRAQRQQAKAEETVASLERQREQAETATRRLSYLTERVRQAEAAADEARLTLERTALQQTNDREEDLRRAVRRAQSEAARARARLRETLVVAPTDGVVERVTPSGPSGVTTGESIATIRRLDTLWADVTVPFSHASRLHHDQTLTATSRALPQSPPLQATVVEITPQTTAPKGPYTVRVSFPNPKQQLAPGMTVQVTFR